MTFNEWTKKQGFSAAELAGPLHELEGCWNSASKAQIKELKQLRAALVVATGAIELLYSWAKNWESEFMNDPDWKDRDALVIQEALTSCKEALK